MYILSVRNLNIFYNGLQALFSVSLVVENEEFLCILGPNGAGKSTLLQTVAGMLVPTGGEIFFENNSIQGIPPNRVVAMGIALVPEEGWLFPQMNVLENLFMGAYPKDSRKSVAERSDFVFDIFPILRERRYQLVETLSGGERQMLAVGRGLMATPSLLMLDEPSLGLAPTVIKTILKALLRLNEEERITILLTEQNVFQALKISKRGYLIENGSVVMEGASDELLESNHIRKNYLGV